MGFCSGTDIFDDVVSDILIVPIEKNIKIHLITSLIESLEKHDWDCQQDSVFWANPIVQQSHLNSQINWELRKMLRINPNATIEEASEIVKNRIAIEKAYDMEYENSANNL